LFCTTFALVFHKARLSRHLNIFIWLSGEVAPLALKKNIGTHSKAQEQENLWMLGLIEKLGALIKKYV